MEARWASRFDAAESFFAGLATLGRTDLLRTHEVPRIKAALETLKVY
jgi:dihydropteroate synthase